MHLSLYFLAAAFILGVFMPEYLTNLVSAVTKTLGL